MLPRPITTALILAVLLPAICSAAPYTIIDLGEIDDSSTNFIRRRAGSFATALNSHGEVAGVSSVNRVPLFPPTGRHAFLYSGGQMQDLGQASATARWPVITALNNGGQIVGATNWDPSNMFDDQLLPPYSPPSSPGELYPNNSNPQSHAFLQSGGVFQDLGTLSGHNRSWAIGVSDDGQIIGVSQATVPSPFQVVQHRTFLYSGGVMQDFGSLINPAYGVSDAIAIDINAGGRVLAEGMINGERHGIIYDNGLVQDFGVLAPGYSYTHISDSGAFIAGIGPYNSEPSGLAGARIVLYHNGVTQTIETFEQSITFLMGSQEIQLDFQGRFEGISGVNSSGQVVGTMVLTNALVGSWRGPFLFSDGAVTPVPGLVDSTGWALISGGSTNPNYPDLEAVTGINDAGQMTGWGRVSNGRTHAFLMTPVPEPSSFIVALLGGVGLLGWQALRRTRR